jgi:chromate reductase
MTAPPSFRLLGLSGSIRKDSYSTAILRTVKDGLPEGATMEIFDLRPLPPYDEDDDEEPRTPDAVRALKSAVAACDGMFVVSPEFNHGMTGVLKNAIDWVSRPGYESILKGKPVALVTISSSPRGGIRAQSHLHDVFLSTVSRIVPGRQVAIGGVEGKVAGGRLTDASSLRAVTRLTDALIAEITLLRR